MAFRAMLLCVIVVLGRIDVLAAVIPEERTVRKRQLAAALLFNDIIPPRCGGREKAIFPEAPTDSLAVGENLSNHGAGLSTGSAAALGWPRQSWVGGEKSTEFSHVGSGDCFAGQERS
jgi:hypothetical protein